MEQNPHRVSRRNNCGTHFNNGLHDEDDKRRRFRRRGDEEEEEQPGVKCSGKRCRSWAAGAIADCVALCCCPCAIINLLTLTFVKVPWMIGRKCLGGGRNKKKRRLLHKKINREDEFHHRRRFDMTTDEEEEFRGVVGVGGCCGGGDGCFDDFRFVVERDGSLTKEEGEAKTTAYKGEECKTTSYRGEVCKATSYKGEECKTTSCKGEDETRISARVEAERVWLELYQIGHLGFGRVSFTGIQ